MELFGFTIARTKSIPLQPLSGRGGWWRVINEPYAGAWQRNESIDSSTVMTNAAMYACVSTIAQDISKLPLRLVERTGDGIWEETESAAFSPVLRKPNHYQLPITFVEQWIMSKLTNGNTYVLKQRDNRGVVVALYVLDPSRVTPLVATDGSVYYELKRDDLSRLGKESVTVPASEIIHDVMVPLYHPLVGVSPIYAAGVAAQQGNRISSSSSTFFSNSAIPGGILTAPLGISTAQAAEMKTTWETEFGGDNAGKVAILGGDLKYTPLGQTAVDSQLIEQLKMTDERVCACYHVPPFIVDMGQPPPYANFAPMIQKYYNQCLQILIVKLETHLDAGLGLINKVEGRQLGTEFDISDLIWMDADTRADVSAKSIGSGAMSPNESRKMHFGLPPVVGGDTPYLQEQNWPLRQLNSRELPTRPMTEPAPLSAEPDDETDEMDEAAAFMGAYTKEYEAGHAA